MTESSISESTETVEEHTDHSHDIPADSRFVVIALALAVLTAFEVAATEVSGFPDSLLVPFLLVLMAIKFYVVIAYFMHLKWDSKVFSLMFYIGLAFAVVLYGVMLTTFGFFAG